MLHHSLKIFNGIGVILSQRENKPLFEMKVNQNFLFSALMNYFIRTAGVA
jgi:hypothetical protein